MQYGLHFSYDHDFPVKIGDIFYSLDSELQIFHGYCPVCKGENKLTVNGVTFECPVCKKGEHNICKVEHFYVRAYKITSVEIKDDYNSWNSPGGRNIKFTMLKHRQRGEYADSYIVTYLDKLLDKAEISENKTPVDYTHFFFRDHSSLVKAARKLNEKEEALLQKFNDSEGTSFELKPWKMKNENELKHK